MKRKSFIPVLVLIVASLLFAACDGGGVHVTFKFDDVKYSWKEGIEGSLTAPDDSLIVYEGGAMGTVSIGESDDFAAFALPDVFAVSDAAPPEEPLNYIVLETGAAVGIYSATAGDADLELAINGVGYYIDVDDTLTIEITGFGAEDGYVKGTFSGTVTADTLEGTTHNITNGKFNVKRIVDDGFPFM